MKSYRKCSKHYGFAGVAVLLIGVTAHAAPSAPSDNDVVVVSERVAQGERVDREVGYRAGSFTIIPAISGGVLFSDNVYATQTGEESDVALTLAPTISLNSNWNNHQLDIKVKGALQRYVDNSSENTEDYGISADGRIDIQRDSYVYGSLGYEQLHEQRTSVNDVGGFDPNEYNRLHAVLGVNHTGGRMRYDLSQAIENLSFDNNRNALGVVDNSLRDRDRYTTTAKISYEIKPNYSAFVSVAYDRVNYDRNAGLDRDSDGLEVNVGTDIAVTGKVKAGAFVGLVSRDYENTALDDINSFNMGADVVWNVTGKTSLIGSIIRDVRETIEINSAGYIDTEYSVKAEHELRSNVVLSGEVAVRQLDFDGGIGAQRDDEVYTLTLGGKYYLSRDATIDASYGYSTRDSSVIGQDYDVNQLIVQCVVVF